MAWWRSFPMTRMHAAASSSETNALDDHRKPPKSAEVRTHAEIHVWMTTPFKRCPVADLLLRRKMETAESKLTTANH